MLPCGTWIQTSNRVWVWYWDNKSRARIVLDTPAQTSFVSCPALNFPPFLNIATRTLHAVNRFRRTLDTQTRVMKE